MKLEAWQWYVKSNSLRTLHSATCHQLKVIHSTGYVVYARQNVNASITDWSGQPLVGSARTLVEIIAPYSNQM